MSVEVSAKIRDFAAFERDFRPGDELLLFSNKPLIFAALSNNRPEVRFAIASSLLDRQAVVTGANSEGDGALSILLSRKTQDFDQTTELVRRLVAAGADPTQRARRGVTPTQWVAQLPVADSEIQPLLDFWFSLPGLDPAAPNDFGKSPIDLAGDSPTKADRVRRMREYRV